MLPNCGKEILTTCSIILTETLLKNGHVQNLPCVLLHTLSKTDLHHVNNSFRNLSDGNVDDLPTDTIGNSLQNDLDHLQNLPPTLWNCHVNNLLTAAVRHLFLRNVLKHLPNFSRIRNLTRQRFAPELQVWEYQLVPPSSQKHVQGKSY